MGGVQQGNIAKGSNGEATQSSEETQCVWRSIWGLVSALGLRETVPIGSVWWAQVNFFRVVARRCHSAQPLRPAARMWPFRFGDGNDGSEGSMMSATERDHLLRSRDASKPSAVCR